MRKSHTKKKKNKEYNDIFKREKLCHLIPIERNWTVSFISIISSSVKIEIWFFAIESCTIVKNTISIITIPKKKQYL